MRIQSAVISISWIPSEAVKGALKAPFSMGVAHYDDPPPEIVEDLAALRDADRFRFANRLDAWIEVQDVGEFWGGRALRLGGKEMTFAAVPFPDRRPEPEVTETFVRFTQTAGGRTGAPAPRPVARPPYVQFAAPTAWTTLSLTLHADGRVEYGLAGASPFPRHWLYDGDGRLIAKSGLIDFKEWSKHAFGSATPWGEEDSPALVTEVETALERQLSLQIMRGGATPKKRSIKQGKTLVTQGDAGTELFLLLDGVLDVEVDGEVVAQVGPGAILGERALLEGGARTSTLRAATTCAVAVAAADQIDRSALEEVARGHRREEASAGERV
jgi:hypothetical protein